MVHVVLPEARDRAPHRIQDPEKTRIMEEYGYKGLFDKGYEEYRTDVLPKMIEKGILPAGTQLTPLNPLPDGVANEGDHVPAHGMTSKTQ